MELNCTSLRRVSAGRLARVRSHSSNIICSAINSQKIHLSYQTSWDNPTIHYSWFPNGAWEVQPLTRSVVSHGPQWTHLALSPPHSDPVELEFVIADGNGAWDKAPGDQNYKISASASDGKYRLSHGALHPVTLPRVLLVSDLDDTMIGDDEATAAFTAWWRTVGVCAGGRLVFNTGRALDLFEELLQERAHCLAEPDYLISSVGTKLYTKKGNAWVENDAYAALLGSGWDLPAVREAAYAALVAVGKDVMHFRPPSEMNEFKVTCGVAVGVLPTVLARIEGELKTARVSYRAIVSGKGDWRYVDLVPKKAGKLAALEYVREELGFAHEETVAAGDSGNDLDMLQGQNHAIVVGNAQPDLMDWVREQQLSAPARAPMVTQATRAHGILEGLQRLGFAEK